MGSDLHAIRIHASTLQMGSLQSAVGLPYNFCKLWGSLASPYGSTMKTLHLKTSHLQWVFTPRVYCTLEIEKDLFTGLEAPRYDGRGLGLRMLQDLQLLWGCVMLHFVPNLGTTSPSFPVAKRGSSAQHALLVCSFSRTAISARLSPVPLTLEGT